MSNTVEADLRVQFRAAFEDAEFPVEDQMELVPALPDGPGTRFEAGEFSVSAMELAANLDGHQDFPYDSVDDLVDDVIAALESEGML